jgi:myo-inositol 2-dehydrogenase/D-chiro-inositol 1-dehydrogenase
MTAPVRVGVLGTGRIGAMHAKLLAHELPGAELAMVYDASPEAATGLGARVARSADELVFAPDVDAVAICTTSDTHVDLVVLAAEAGKPIFCEKPISLDLAEVDRALSAVERSGVLFMVGFNRRFDPGHRSVRDAVAEGEIGEVHIVRITSRDPEPPPLEYVRRSGGLFLDMTIHDFDMARFVTESDVVSVFARGAVRIDPEIASTGDIDTAALVLTHADGTLTLIDNSRRAVYGFDQRVEAFGSKGVASSRNLPSHGGTRRTSVGTVEPRLPTFFLERYIPSYLAEWAAFLAAVVNGSPSPVPGADGRAPLLVGLAAQRSLREERPVQVGVDECAST